MPAATRFGRRYIIWEWLFLNQYALKVKRDWFNNAEITTNFKEVFGQLCSTGAEAATALLDLNKYRTKQGPFSEEYM